MTTDKHPISLLKQTFFCGLNRTVPINVNMRFQTLHHSILFILFCYTNLGTDPHVNKDFLFEFFRKDSFKVGAPRV